MWIPHIHISITKQSTDLIISTLAIEPSILFFYFYKKLNKFLFSIASVVLINSTKFVFSLLFG